jgi:hypothetical protein
MSALTDVRARAVLSAVLAFVLFWHVPTGAIPWQEAAPQAVVQSEAAATEEPTLEQKLEFLRKARVIRSRHTKKGITAPTRVTLSDGTLTHDALFQSVDEKRMEASFAGGRREFQFRDYWGFNVAAFRIAVLLGYPDLIPATVERSHQGRHGCLVWWVNEAIDQLDIKEQALKPPDAVAFSREIMRGRVFGALVGDTDRNLTNNLFTPSWRIVLIDFTRAFRLHPTLEHRDSLRTCERRLFEGMKTLTRENVREETSRHLSGPQIDALLKRRDALVQHFTRLIEAKGEAMVLYD